MKVLEALDQLNQLPAIRRDKWPKSEGYLIKLPDAPFVLKVLVEPKLNLGVHALSLEELACDDWEMFDGKWPTQEACVDIAPEANA